MKDLKMLAELMKAKKSPKLSPEFKSAKLGVLKGLHKDMGDLMKDDVKSLKKVTVAAPDAEGLKEGLKKAEDVVEEQAGEEGEGEEGEMCPMCSVGKCSEHEEDSEMPSSLEEVEAKIKELEALKMKLAQKE